MKETTNTAISSLRLEVTSQCNLNCLYCHNNEFSNSTDDMDNEQLKKLIVGLKENKPINKILLTGGEYLI